MVELEHPDAADLAEVRALVEEHRDRTGSTVAERVLAGWEALTSAWVKVMPMDYKRVLREREERQRVDAGEPAVVAEHGDGDGGGPVRVGQGDRKSTRLNSSHANISYAVFCLKKKHPTLTC